MTTPLAAVVRGLRLDAGFASPDELALALGWNPAIPPGSDPRRLEEGEDLAYPWSAGWVLRGAVALWMLRRGGWRIRPNGGGYRRDEDRAHIQGNGTSSWCCAPGVPMLHESMAPEDIQGPVVRRDVLRLMIKTTPRFHAVVAEILAGQPGLNLAALGTGAALSPDSNATCTARTT